MSFISKVLQWQLAGYVSKDVWNEMDKIVGPDLLPSQQEIDTSPEPVLEFDSDEQANKEADDNDDDQKLLSTSEIYNFACEITYPNIYPSKRKEFALQALGLTESKYNHINNNRKGAEQKNYEVF